MRQFQNIGGAVRCHGQGRTVQGRTVLAFVFAAALGACAFGYTRPAHLAHTQDSVDFESWTMYTTAVATGVDDKGVPDTDDSHFVYRVSDASPVTGDASPATSSKVAKDGTTYTAGRRAREFRSDSISTKSLKVAVDAGTLYRTVKPLASIAAGEAKLDFAETDLWVDMLVKFSVSTKTPEVPAAGKLAIWLDASSNVCVKACAAVSDALVGGFTFTPKTIVLNKQILDGAWHRLTVRAFANVSASEDVLPAFVVAIDGVDVPAKSTNPITCDVATEIDAAYAALASGKCLLPSLAECGDDCNQFYGVGFKGAGYVDEYFVSTAADPETDEENALAATAVDFTLAFGAGVSAVSYLVDGENKGAMTSGKPVSVVQNAAVTLVPKYADWYTNAVVAADDAGCAVSDGLVVEVTDNAHATISATRVDADVAAKVATPAALGVSSEQFPEEKGYTAGEIAAWASAQGVSVAAVNKAAAGLAEASYLLNVPLLAAAPELAVMEMDAPGADGTMALSVQVNEGAVDLSAINGKIIVVETDDLSARAEDWTTVSPKITTDGAKATLTFKPSKRFMRTRIVKK